VKIVAGLRTFSRAQAGEAAPFDVNEGLEESLALIGHLVRAGGVEIVRELGELPKIQCKGGEVNQVFLNLLTNAVQSGARRIVLRTRRTAEAVEIEIADDGTGIGEQELSRIFDPFYTTKPVGSGTGLGLSISLGIVRAHGGTIAADSRVGQGTTFRVRLPV
jgi:signal transduction histidine kinase